MAITVKAYTFVANTVADASEVNRVIDDIYADYNGNINSANIATTFTLAASQVTINNTAGAFSSVTVQGALEEIKIPKGYNGIHITPQGCNACVFHNGLIEIKGVSCKISVNLSASGFAHVNGSAIKNYTPYAFVASACVEITKSDIFLIETSNVINSNSLYDISGLGFYYSDKRIIGNVFNRDGLGKQDILECNQIQKIDSPYSINLTGTGALEHLGFYNVTSIAAGGFYYLNVTREYNGKNYKYHGYCHMPSSTGTYLLYRHPDPMATTHPSINANFKIMAYFDAVTSLTMVLDYQYVDINTINGIGIRYEVSQTAITLCITTTGAYTTNGFDARFSLDLNYQDVLPTRFI